MGILDFVPRKENERIHDFSRIRNKIKIELVCDVCGHTFIGEEWMTKKDLVRCVECWRHDGFKEDDIDNNLR